MIRFLQRDNRVVKAFFWVIIGAASVSMCVYLIPGLTGASSVSANTYAVIYPHWYSRYLGGGEEVSQQKVEQMAREQIQQRSPQYAGNPMILGFFEQQVGQQMVQQQVLMAEAEKLGVHATDQDVITFLHQGSFGEYLFPKGQFIGEDQYTSFVASRFNMSVSDFENEIKKEVVRRRMQALITAGVTVSDKEVRDSYRKQNVKVKFDYAVVSADDIRKSIDPSDSDLEAFFKKNNARYAHGVPEERAVTYFAFTPDQLPGGVPQPSQQEIQAYFNAHQSEYTAPEQAKSRHILIKVAAGADAKTDAAAKAKAEDVLKQLKAGGNFADLAKKYSDDTSKDQGGELGFYRKGATVPEFETALFNQKIGDIQIVKSQFGYHILQVEERQAGHVQTLNEVLPTIQATLIREKASQAEDNYSKTLTAEAAKNGLAKTAAAHHLEVATTPMLPRQGTISALPDGSQMLAKAFEAKQGDAPQSAPTGEGFAIFQLAGITPAHAPTFADWKSHVLDDYRDEQLPVLLSLKTQELASKAKADGGDLAKAAKELGASVKTSDLVGESGQVPEFGQVGQVAPQLFDMKVGDIAGPITAEKNGVVAKLVDKQEPSADDIAKNFDQTKDQMLEQRRQDAFNVFTSSVEAEYKKNKRIQLNAKSQGPAVPGM